MLNGADADDDNDLLADATELPLGLESCKADTDGDAVGDGYEYQSARDLDDDGYQQADTYLPYPGKRPYPNPLDGTDAGIDFDGDSLTLNEEFRLWNAFEGSRNLESLLYSDGAQCSISERGAGGRRTCTLRADEYRTPGQPGTRHRQAEFLAWAAGAGYARLSPDGVTSWEVLDVDHGALLRRLPPDGPRRSGLGRRRRARRRRRPGSRRPAQPRRAQPQRGQRPAAREPGQAARAAEPRPGQGPRQPVQPCLPSTASRTCNTHPPFEGAWAAFGADEKIYYVFN